MFLKISDFTFVYSENRKIVDISMELKIDTNIQI